jgi:hypothetical protein
MTELEHIMTGLEHIHGYLWQQGGVLRLHAWNMARTAVLCVC